MLLRKSRQMSLQSYQTGNYANRIGAVSRREPLHFHLVRIKLQLVDYPLQGFPNNGSCLF
jgi:hypothetical protein